MTDLMELASRCDAMTPDCDGVEGIDYLGACAAKAVADFPVLARRCAACAFTPGTEANGNPTTTAAARECVERSHPFWCHKAEDGDGFKTHLCAGWIDGLRARAHQGTAHVD